VPIIDVEERLTIVQAQYFGCEWALTSLALPCLPSQKALTRVRRTKRPATSVSPNSLANRLRHERAG
jgi:hypothetical protein